MDHLGDYCDTYSINDINYIINNPSWNENKKKETFAMFLATMGIIPSE